MILFHARVITVFSSRSTTTAAIGLPLGDALDSHTPLPYPRGNRPKHQVSVILDQGLMALLHAGPHSAVLRTTPPAVVQLQRGVAVTQRDAEAVAESMGVRQ